MRWLNPGEADELLRSCAIEPQTFILPCEAEDLTPHIAAKPRCISTDEGVATSTKEWVGIIEVGLIDRRPVVIQQESFPDREPTRSLTVLTPYMQAEWDAGEWSALRQLQSLPAPIRPSRPIYIQGHAASDDHVVCRPNGKGWFHVIYRAKSIAEAEGLVLYLQLIDSWNEGCFVAKIDSPGEWTIFTQKRRDRILGAYPDVDSAVRVALSLSDGSPEDVLVVRDVSRAHGSNEYRIARGQVERAAG